MLPRQDGGRGHEGDLLAAEERHGRSPQRHLGLAEADVAAYQPIHLPAARHIVEHGLDGPVLVRRLGEQKAGGERLI